jgi:hypothetical protein
MSPQGLWSHFLDHPTRPWLLSIISSPCHLLCLAITVLIWTVQLPSFKQTSDTTCAKKWNSFPHNTIVFCFSPIWGIILRVFDIDIFKRWGFLSDAQFPTRRIGVLFYVLGITSDLSGMGDPARSCITASRARRHVDSKAFDARGDWRKQHDEDLHDIVVPGK